MVKIPYAKAVVKLENLILHSDSVYLFDVNSYIEFFNIYNPKLWIASTLNFMYCPILFELRNVQLENFREISNAYTNTNDRGNFLYSTE